MNTADRSIALVDYAIRRRFSFFSVLPKVEIVEEFYRNPDAHCGDKVVAEQLGPKVRALYQAIFGMFDGIRDADDIRIGHSYLLVQGIRNGEPLSEKEWAVSIAFRFAFEVVPMLSEYQKERRLRDGVEEIAVDGQSFSLNLANQNQTRSALEKWLAME
jgi:5-methylcytosine-specific restriction protein B